MALLQQPKHLSKLGQAGVESLVAEFDEQDELKHSLLPSGLDLASEMCCAE